MKGTLCKCLTKFHIVAKLHIVLLHSQNTYFIL